MANTQHLRSSLLANAAFSLGTGVMLAAASTSVSSWLGVSIDGWLRLLGIALVSHCAVLLWATSRESFNRLAALNLLAIAPYPLLMLILVAARMVETRLGIALVLLDGFASLFVEELEHDLESTQQLNKPLMNQRLGNENHHPRNSSTQ